MYQNSVIISFRREYLLFSEGKPHAKCNSETSRNKKTTKNFIQDILTRKKKCT
jgi:hypothetical protein